MKRAVTCLAVAAALMTCVGPLFAQDQPHTYSQEAIERGGEIFQSGCARCHGLRGDEVSGVNLASGRFLRVTTDDELAKLIVDGIPGTGMPSNNLPARDVNGIVAYLRSLASGGAAVEISNTAIRNAESALPGDAGRGKLIVEGKGRCLTCHSVGGEGGRLGPDLSGIGIRKRSDLQTSLVDPAAEIRTENRTVRLVTRDGATVTGRLLNHDSFTVQLIDSKEQLRSFQKSGLREFTFLKTSPMPSYRETLTADEITDVVKYLSSMRGR
jgi:putative heme-binding domain-containing protein